MSPSVLGSEVGEESEPHRVMVQNWVDTEKFEKGWHCQAWTTV